MYNPVGVLTSLIDLTALVKEGSQICKNTNWNKWFCFTSRIFGEHEIYLNVGLLQIMFKVEANFG